MSAGQGGGLAGKQNPDLRGSCRQMEDAGWLRTLRNRQTLQLAVELTDTGRAVATRLLADEQAVAREQQRRDDVRVQNNL